AYSKADGTGDYGMPAGTETPVTFACAAPMTGADETITIKGTAYKYVAMDYILPAMPTDAYDVDITFCTANEAKQYSVPTFAGVTFERNHRTNIMGSLLTDPAKFVVEIDEEFDDPDYDLAEQKSIQVSTAADFAAALATDAKFIVMAPGIYDGDYNLRNSAKTISSLDPANKAVITGKFVANSDVVFENIDFKPSEKSMKVLSTSTYGSYVNKGYTSIVTINRVKATFENCAFTELNDSYAASAINYFQEATGKVLEVNNCSFEGVAKAIYTKVLCKVTNSTFNLGDGAVPLYVWPRATGEGMLEVTNNDNLAAAKAYAAVGCLSQTAPFANVEFNVQNNSNMSGYAATNSARFATDGSVTFAAGSETFEITAEGKMQSSAAPVTSIRVNSAAQLKEALASTTLETIYLAPGTYDEVYYHSNGTKKIASGNPENKAVISGKFVAQSDVVFENVDFTPSAKSLTDLSTSTYGSKVNGSYHSIVTISYAVASFEGCSFSGLNTTYQASAINYFTESSGKVLKVNNCSFEGIAKAIYSKVLFEVTNSHFDLEDGVAIYVWPRATGEGKAVFTGNENAHANSMIAIGCLTQSGNYANMTFNVQGNTGTIRSYAAVNSARFDAATITFADGSETFAISAEGKML
ncbi:MAG: hypothetical protein IJC47_05250, partial [Alistipes sp.]|nr:hypothetical protein [Alistipes sp.]